MAKIFLVLSIIASIGAAVLGYMTNEQVTKVGAKLDATKKDLLATQGKLKTTQAELVETKATLETTKTALATEQEKTKTLETQLTDMTTQKDAAVAKVAEMQGQLDKANQDIAALKAAIGGGKAGDGGNIFETQMNELKAQVAEQQAIAKNLQAKLDESEQHAAKLAADIKAHADIINRPGLEGTVMAVNQGYNFAVISIGDRAGAIPNAQVLVKRGNDLVAKLKITTVEASTSIADIIPDSLAKGQQVRPGDRVIFTGTTVK